MGRGQLLLTVLSGVRSELSIASTENYIEAVVSPRLLSNRLILNIVIV